MLVFIGIDKYPRVLSNEYLCARLSIIFQVFASCCIGQISLQQQKGYKARVKKQVEHPGENCQVVGNIFTCLKQISSHDLW